MKRILIALIAFCFMFGSAFAIVNTGDAALDESLNTLTEQVKDKPEDFINTNLALRFNQSKDKLVTLLNKEKLDASEVFIISYLAVTNNKDIDAVYAEFKANNRNWSKLLESYKIKKGSKEYKKFLKASINIHPKPFLPKVK